MSNFARDRIFRYFNPLELFFGSGFVNNPGYTDLNRLNANGRVLEKCTLFL